MRFDVLLVEDEESLLRGLVRGLSTDPSLNVTGVADVEAALESIARTTPDLVITDLRLPGRSGFELIRELEQRHPEIPVVVTTAYRAGFRNELAARTGLAILEKPVPVTQLRQVVRDKLERHSRGERADSAPFDLVDYLQLAALGHHSIRVEGEVDSGEQIAVDVFEGEIWNVRVGELRGKDALVRLIAERPSAIRFVRADGAPEGRELHGPTEGLLLAAAHARDEGAAGEPSEIDEDEIDAALGPVESTQVVVPMDDAPVVASTDGDALCREVVESIPGARAFAGVDVESGAVVASFGPGGEASALLGGDLISDLLAVARTPRLGEEMEVLLLGSERVRLLVRSRGDRHLGVLVAMPGLRPGLARISVREAMRSGRIRSAAAGRSVFATGEPASVPDTENCRERRCGWLVASVEHALWCGVVDRTLQELVAVSGSIPEELALSAPWMVRLALRGEWDEPHGSGLDASGLREVQMSLAAHSWYLIPSGRPREVLLLAAGAGARPGPLWLALREELGKMTPSLG